MNKRLLVSIVDDDESVRESLPDLLSEFGFDVQAFAAGEQFLTSGSMEETRCLILDVAMPDMSGFDVQRVLSERNSPIPIVFMTAHCDEVSRKDPRVESAVACLLKPFSDTELFEAIRAAVGTH